VNAAVDDVSEECDMRRPLLAVVTCCIGLFAPATLQAQGIARNDGHSWPTLHGDLTRAGFYPHFPAGHLTLAWRQELYRELIATRCEPIVAQGLVFIGTCAGNLYAFHVDTGQQAWVFPTRGVISHCPMYADGCVYFASMDRHLYAVDAATGQLKWQYMAGEGFSASPVVHAQRVLIGDRAGVFHAVDTHTGQMAWCIETDAPILTTAAVSLDGRCVVFSSEDMHVRCADVSDSRLLWKSETLQGLSLRDYFPVIVNNLVFVTTNPVQGFHETLNKQQEFLLQRVGRKYGEADDRFVPGGPDDVEQEQHAIVEYLQQHPAEQTFYALDLGTGAQPWIAPIFYTAGLHDPPSVPCCNPLTGEVFVLVRSAFTVWDGGGEVRPLTGVGKLSLDTGRVTLLVHGYASREPGRPPGSPDMPYASFNTIGDETQALSCAPGRLLSNHQGFLGMLDLVSGQCQSLFGQRDTYAGFYGPALFGWEDQGGLEKARAAGQPYALVNEWHGPARGIAAVVGDRVFYVSGSQVLCFAGE
jgi:outer membrane protein assembly factor BamB